jgi:hypothetical protein
MGNKIAVALQTPPDARRRRTTWWPYRSRSPQVASPWQQEESNCRPRSPAHRSWTSEHHHLYIHIKHYILFLFSHSILLITRDVSKHNAKYPPKVTKFFNSNTLYLVTMTSDLDVWRKNTGSSHDTPSSGHVYLKNLYRWRLTLNCDLQVWRRNTGFVHDTPSSGHTYSCKIWMEYLSRLKSSGPETKNNLYRWRLTVTCDLQVWRRNTGFVHDTPSSGHTYSCKIWMEYLSLLKSSGPEMKKWDGRTG